MSHHAYRQVLPLITPGQNIKSSPPVAVPSLFSARHYFQYLFRWGPGEGEEEESNTPRLLPIAPATPRKVFLGPPPVWCGHGLHRKKSGALGGMGTGIAHHNGNGPVSRGGPPRQAGLEHRAAHPSLLYQPRAGGAAGAISEATSLAIQKYFFHTWRAESLSKPKVVLESYPAAECTAEREAGLAGLAGLRE